MISNLIGLVGDKLTSMIIDMSKKDSQMYYCTSRQTLWFEGNHTYEFIPWKMLNFTEIIYFATALYEVSCNNVIKWVEWNISILRQNNWLFDSF